MSLPCGQAIQLLIKKRFQIDIKRRTLCNYLKAWGFRVQRPAKRAIQQDPKAVADWLENQYLAIERKAKSENVQIPVGTLFPENMGQ